MFDAGNCVSHEQISISRFQNQWFSNFLIVEETDKKVTMLLVLQFAPNNQWSCRLYDYVYKTQPQTTNTSP